MGGCDCLLTPPAVSSPMATTCEAPCSPSCTRPAVAGGHCAGHYKRARAGLPIDVPLGRRTARGSEAGQLVNLTMRIPPEMRAQVLAEAKVRGVTPSEAGHQGMDLWLKTKPRKR